MKKVLLMCVVVAAMTGVSNAQQTAYCAGSPAPVGGCGYYDNGAWVFTKCFVANCQIDNNNCGSIGNVCGGSQFCSAGTCTCEIGADPECPGGPGGIQPSRRSPIRKAAFLQRIEHPKHTLNL